MILYITEDNREIVMDNTNGNAGSSGPNADSNTIYFETYKDYRKAYVENKIDNDTLVVIKSGEDDGSGGTAIKIPMDETLSSVSGNPVTNKAITQEINSLKETISNLNSTISNMQKSINNISSTLGTQVDFTLNGNDLIITTK